MDLDILVSRVSRGNGTERGAVLGLLAATLFVLIGVGGLAVDLAATQSRGQELQNAADAAALAGAAIWSPTLSEAGAEAAVDDLLAQNGIGGDVTWDVTFPTPQEVSVAVHDPTPIRLLGRLLRNDSGITRSASASFAPCDPTCTFAIDIPRPFSEVNYGGEGDGYRPIVVGNKIYAARHQDRTLTCIDRNTNGLCWDTDSRNLFSNDDLFTMNVTHSTLVGTRLFHLGFEDAWSSRDQNFPTATGAIYIGCWETTTDTRCGETLITTGERHGMMAATDDAIYIFTNHRKVHCFDPATLALCADYDGGRDMDAQSQPWNDADLAMRNSTYREHNGRIYTTISHLGPHFIQCWDTNYDEPCESFGTFEVNDNSAIGGVDTIDDIWVEGRLFFARTTTGEPTAICSSGQNQVECFDLITGARDATVEAPLDGFASSWAHMYAGVITAGQHTYHESSNRTFFLGQVDDDRTYCWDWASGDCGTVHHVDGLGSPWPYGYWPTPECLFGLGHNKIFWTLKPDMSGGCDHGALQLLVEPCMCNGEPAWPSVTMQNPEGVESFEVRLIDAAGDAIWPSDGSAYQLGGDDTLDLAQILQLNFDPITIEVIVESSPGQNPWEDGLSPRLALSSPTSWPQLTG